MRLLPTHPNAQSNGETDMKKLGRVFLVGAGPGDPDLLTVKALRILCSAEVVVYDRLVSREILDLVPQHTRMIPVGKAPKCHPVPQEEINRILVREAAEGVNVVRLKGGDPSIFGRGSEEAIALLQAGFRVDIVPGITAAQGCAAAAGVPLTHRGLATGVRYITGHCAHDKALDFDWRSLADAETTLVIYMGVANIAEIADRLLTAGLSKDMPVLAVNNGTMPRERRLISNLGFIAKDTAEANFEGPVLFLVGHVVSLYGARLECPVISYFKTYPPLQVSAHA